MKQSTVSRHADRIRAPETGPIDLQSKPVIPPSQSPQSRIAVSDIQSRILGWYAENRRDLPWRRTVDPYAILVSEIMLQQTGVDRVAPAYERFLARFPSFAALAEASRLEVLRAWAGLGYNRRAVQLHELAKAVVERHGGILPSDPAALRALPGIGPYTQAAIESFVFGRDRAALDTNVRRVVDRVVLGGTGRPGEIGAAAASLVPPGQGATWNQALMDFGAIQCVATSPGCLICPLGDLCRAAPVAPGRAGRAIREKSEKFVGSRRYYRGRVVAVLRGLRSDQSLSAAELLERIKPNATPNDVPWLESLVESLAQDGLARLDTSHEALRFGPPL